MEDTIRSWPWWVRGYGYGVVPWLWWARCAPWIRWARRVRWVFWGPVCPMGLADSVGPMGPVGAVCPAGLVGAEGPVGSVGPVGLLCLMGLGPVGPVAGDILAAGVELKSTCALGRDTTTTMCLGAACQCHGIVSEAKRRWEGMLQAGLQTRMVLC